MKELQKSRKQNRVEKKKPVAPKKSGASSKSLCPVEKRCGSCQYLHLTYPQQLKGEEEKLKELLKGICPVKGMLGIKCILCSAVIGKAIRFPEFTKKEPTILCRLKPV